MANPRIDCRSGPQAERAQQTDRQLADAGDGEQPGCLLQLGTDDRSGGAERPPSAGPHIGACDDSDLAAIGSRHQTVEHVDTAPRAMSVDQPQPDVPVLRRRRPTPADRRAIQELVEVRLVVPDGEERRAPQVGGRPGVRPTPGAEQSPEAQARDAPEARAVDGEMRHGGDRAVVAHEVERRHTGHDRPCWHRCAVPSGSPCLPSPAI